MKLVSQRVQILDWPDYPAEDVEWAARTCYQSHGKITGDSAEKMVRALIKRGHEAMVEHVHATVEFTTSRAIANEIVRHRMASYAQVSTRYVDYKDDIEFILPNDITLRQREEMEYMCLRSEEAYKHLRGIGAAPQVARDILPLCLATTLVMTANFREWRHFIKLRGAPDAHPMIRELALVLLDTFRKLAPEFVEDIDYETEATA